MSFDRNQDAYCILVRCLFIKAVSGVFRDEGFVADLVMSKSKGKSLHQSQCFVDEPGGIAESHSTHQRCLPEGQRQYKPIQDHAYTGL